jgi:hypothetical protein
VLEDAESKASQSGWGLGSVTTKIGEVLFGSTSPADGSTEPELSESSADIYAYLVSLREARTGDVRPVSGSPEAFRQFQDYISRDVIPSGVSAMRDLLQAINALARMLQSRGADWLKEEYALLLYCATNMRL